MAKLRYKLIIFDFDGTLADSFPFFLGAIDATTQRFGLRRIDPSELESLRACSAREMIARCGLPIWKLPLVVRYMRGLMTEHAGEIGLFHGVEDVLRQLVERGAVLSIVSSNSEMNVRRILGPANAELITLFSCGASVFGKARRFREVLKITGFAREEAICIGDEIRDIEAARIAGIPFGAVSWGCTNAPALAKHLPEALFATPAEILALIDPLAPPRTATALPEVLPEAPVP